MNIPIWKRIMYAAISTIVHLVVMIIGLFNMMFWRIDIPMSLVYIFWLTFIISFCAWAHYDSLETQSDWVAKQK